MAQRKQLSTSEVVRQAIEEWADRQEPGTSPYEAVRDLIGVVQGGNPKRSVRQGDASPYSLRRGAEAGVDSRRLAIAP